MFLFIIRRLACCLARLESVHQVLRKVPVLRPGKDSCNLSQGAAEQCNLTASVTTASHQYDTIPVSGCKTYN